MNMTVTLDSLLYKYLRSPVAIAPEQEGEVSLKAGLDPSVHMLVAEDHAMLNTGAFFLKASDWSREFLRGVWGPEDSVWVDHPWCQSPPLLCGFLRGNSQKFRTGDPAAAVEGDDTDADEMQ